MGGLCPRRASPRGGDEGTTFLAKIEPVQCVAVVSSDLGAAIEKFRVRLRLARRNVSVFRAQATKWKAEGGPRPNMRLGRQYLETFKRSVAQLESLEMAQHTVQMAGANKEVFTSLRDASHAIRGLQLDRASVEDVMDNIRDTKVEHDEAASLMAGVVDTESDTRLLEELQELERLVDPSTDTFAFHQTVAVQPHGSCHIHVEVGSMDPQSPSSPSSSPPEMSNPGRRVTMIPPLSGGDAAGGVGVAMGV